MSPLSCVFSCYRKRSIFIIKVTSYEEEGSYFEEEELSCSHFDRTYSCAIYHKTITFIIKDISTTLKKKKQYLLTSLHTCPTKGRILRE